MMEAKSADGVSVIVMKPDNGEILAMVNVPEFDLNDPFTLIDAGTETMAAAGESGQEPEDTEESEEEPEDTEGEKRCTTNGCSPGSGRTLPKLFF